MGQDLTITQDQPVCYCSKKLKKFNVNWNNWQCDNCWQVYENITCDYSCGTGGKCKYKNITGRNYGVCLNCYNLMRIYNNNNINDIVSKCERQINILSYIKIYILSIYNPYHYIFYIIFI